MALFWIVHRHQSEPSVYIVAAASLIHARLKVSMAKHLGQFTEGHLLDAKSAKKIPKMMIGRSLTMAEATALLGKMG